MGQEYYGENPSDEKQPRGFRGGSVRLVELVSLLANHLGQITKVQFHASKTSKREKYHHSGSVGADSNFKSISGYAYKLMKNVGG